MTLKHLLILLLAVFATSIAQSDDELHIPVENDNQFPPDNHSELDVSPVEGSGAEEHPETTTEFTFVPVIEDVQLTSTLTNVENETPSVTHSCPTSCVCNIEGDSNKYIVDCSGAGLTELPKNLDPKTTELNLQNNQLTEIPKDISALKDLKILNANNNKIMDIVAGSISELPELTHLKLGNNRLMEYPTDLKNSFGLTKLEMLDLGGNDMRTVLKSESFSNFKALRTLTLPSAAANLAEDICAVLKENLATVCTESCNENTFECPDSPDELNFVVPGMVPVIPEEIEDAITSTVSNIKLASENENQDNVQTTPLATVETTVANTIVESATDPIGEASFRSAVIKATDEELVQTKSESVPAEGDAKTTAVQPTKVESTKTEEEVVGATTSSTKTGGVDKSIIGLIVAGMIVVVAGITIKKNWSSIRNRFSSSPRNTNDRTGVNANGTAPEEVPLQEKSPV